MRSGGTPQDVARLDASRIFLGQLCDASRKGQPPTLDELRIEARAHRLYPGEGDAPLHELLDVLPATLEIEIEVPRSDESASTLAQRARKTGDRFRAYMADYGRSRGG